MMLFSFDCALLPPLKMTTMRVKKGRKGVFMVAPDHQEGQLATEEDGGG